MAARREDIFPAGGGNQNRGYWLSEQYSGRMSQAAASLEKLRRKIERFRGLPFNWDSYGAKPISFDAANAALGTLTELLAVGSTMPSVVPTPRGGVQAEWHSGPKSLELEFLSPVNIEFYYADDSTGRIEEETLRFDLGPVYRRIAEF